LAKEEEYMDKQINGIVDKYKDDPDQLFDAFFDWYENIFFSSKDFNDGLLLFESPLRELVAAHQAWGMIGSDGFDNYFRAANHNFDNEVRLGLRLIGNEHCYDALKEARDIFEKHNEIPEDEATRLWRLFYVPIEELEKDVAKFLIEKLG
jgi:hypothetical protein